MSKKLWGLIAFIALCALAVNGWRQGIDYMNAPPEVEIPTPQMPSPNAYYVYVKAGKAIIDSPKIDPIYDPSPPPRQQWKMHYPIEKREAWLQQNATAFTILREGFKYHCRVPLRRSLNTSYFSNNPHVRKLNRILWAQSRVHEERGRLLAAMQNGIDMIRLGTDFSRGGAYVDFLVGSSLRDMGYQRCWELLPRLNNADSRTVIDRLEKLHQTRPTRVAILQEEKNYCQALSLEIMQSDGWRRENWAGKDRRKHLAWFWRLHTSSKRAQFDSYTRYIDALIAYHQKPYLNNSPEPVKPNDLFTHLFGSGYSRFGWNYARAEARGSLLLASLALHLYHSEHGRYPKSLNELSPRYLKKIPADPFGDGGPLRYQPAGAKYRLYSIGPDGKDDGGRAIQDGGRSKAHPNRVYIRQGSKGDFVAGINY